ncbi:MAG: FHA domain-containing protein [Spirochaetia bacterium]|nr:FHA domain-containing protein [Spirochaetia bacterium]
MRPRFEILYESKLVEAGRPALAVDSLLKWQLSGSDEEAHIGYNMPWSGWVKTRMITAGWVGLVIAGVALLLLLLIAVGVGVLVWKAITRRPEPPAKEKTDMDQTADAATKPQGLEHPEGLLVAEEDLVEKEEREAEGLLDYAASGYALSGKPSEKFVRDYSYALLQTALKDADSYKEAALVQRKDGREAKRYDLFLESTVIGRGRYAHVRLNDSTASAVHAKIRKVEGKFVLYDMMSGAGVTLNKKKLLRPRALSDGDEFVVGHTVFRFEGKV